MKKRNLNTVIILMVIVFLGTGCIEYPSNCTSHYTYKIYSTHLTTKIQTELPTEKNDYFPVISPDGRKIAFLRANPEKLTASLYVMNFDGTDMREIYGPFEETDYSSDLKIQWSPKGDKIVFLSSKGIMTIHSNGLNPILLSSKKGRFRIAPDGLRLTFNYGNKIYTANMDGTNEKIIVSDKYCYSIPSWNNDSSKIAFSFYVSAGVYKIATCNPDGSGFEDLYTTNEYIGFVMYSPDGSKILFSNLALALSIKILGIIDCTTLEVKYCPDTTQLICVYFFWMPDSKRIVFLKNENHIINLYIVNASDFSVDVKIPSLQGGFYTNIAADGSVVISHKSFYWGCY